MFHTQLSFLVIVLFGLSKAIPTFGDNGTISLIGHVLRGSDTDNIVFSPYLLYESLMQLYLGAEGDTAKQIGSILHLNGFKREMAIREIVKRVRRFKRSKYLIKNRGSRIFVCEGINILPEYQKRSTNIFNTTAETIDLTKFNETTLQLYDGIATETDNIINSTISEITNDTKIILPSVINFQGKWKHPFNMLDTKKASFFIPDKSGGFRTVLVDMMSGKGTYKYSFIEKLNAYSIKIPYFNSEISMIILLPMDMDGIEEVVKKLDTIRLRDLDPEEAKTNFRLIFPKFKIETTLKLKSALQSLGIQDLFNDANLDFFTDFKKRLFVNEIIQNTVIELDELDSNTTTIQKTNFGKISRQFVAEVKHPFLFFVKDNKEVYLAGRVNSVK